MVRLYIFDKLDQNRFITSKNMEKKDGCIWEISITADLFSDIDNLGMTAGILVILMAR